MILNTIHIVVLDESLHKHDELAKNLVRYGAPSGAVQIYLIESVGIVHIGSEIFFVYTN